MIYLNDDIAHFDWRAALPRLSEQRREQCLRFSHEQGRRECAAAYLLLREALEREYGITEPPLFTYGEHGKPALTATTGSGDTIHFNLSHCRVAALCVVSNCPVGCDIETVRTARESLVRYTMNEAEQQRITTAADPALEFTRLWTQKEAVLKLTGHGLQNDMKSVLEQLNGISVETVASPRGYVYSIASRCENTRYTRCEVRGTRYENTR